MVSEGGRIAPRRGDIFLVDFDPSIGSEIKKVRPALIVQNNIDNEYSPLVIVAAITSKFGEKLYPTEVFIRAAESGLGRDSVVQLNQIRSIDKQRLVRRVGSVGENTLSLVDKSILLSLGLIEL